MPLKHTQRSSYMSINKYEHILLIPKECSVYDDILGRKRIYLLVLLGFSLKVLTTNYLNFSAFKENCGTIEHSFYVYISVAFV